MSYLLAEYIVYFFLFLPTLSPTYISFSFAVPVPVAIPIVVLNFGYMSISRFSRHPLWIVFNASLILLSMFFLTDRTRKALKQMKSDISETLKTLVSAPKEEGQFPHTVARWKLSLRLKSLLKSSIANGSVIICRTSVAPGLSRSKK